MKEKKTKLNKEKVLVGMSGGVDSTVAVALLQKEGYEVYGVFLDLWKSEKTEEDYQSAKEMADKLGISLERVDRRKEFKKKIVDNFIADYKKGITPNPCVVCNPEMKFRILIEEADRRGIKYVATGHYARLRKLTIDSSQFTDEEEFPTLPTGRQVSNFQFPNKFKNPNSKYQSVNCSLKTANYSLMVAKDKMKDQSYFLYRLNQEQLKRVIFPLGSYLKNQVKNIAKDLNLEVAEKKESQDVCFIAKNEINNFLKDYIKDNPGEVQNIEGETLGKHKGIHFYTIGQRRGIDLGGDGPYYVVEKDIKDNLLIVSNERKNSYFSKSEFKIADTNWIKKDIQFPIDANVRLRYHGKLVYAKILKVEKDIYEVKLSEPQKAVTPGQSAVFYEGECILGGGFII